jgi:HEAT repeat protein
MRLLLIGFMLISLSGCGRAQPRMAADKWVETLHSPDHKERRKAAFTLGNIGPSDAAVLPALIEALKDGDPCVRCEAILALLKCGSAAKESIPELAELKSRDKDAKVRSYAVRALEKLEKIE